jgi:hypothetical protein
MSFDQSFVELVTEEFSTPFEGGNGYYVTGETKVEWGWKSFRSGMSLSDSFSPFVFGDRESVLAAKQALVDRVVASGGTAKGKESPKQAVRVLIMKSSVLDTLDTGASKAANWKEDRAYDVSTHVNIKEGDEWKTLPSKDYKEVLLPSIDRFLTTNDLGEWLWLAIGLRGEEYTSAMGEKKTRFTPFIMNRFANEAEARTAVESGNPLNTNAVAEPEGWDTGRFGDWADSVDYLREQLTASLANNAPVPQVNKKVGELVASYAPANDSETSALTNAIMSVWNSVSKVETPF